MKLPKLSLFQIAVHLVAWVPLALIVKDALQDNLTANPIQDLTLRTGKAALWLLVLSLAATPVNTVFGFRPALKVRRALGLYAFFYVLLHFLIFTGLDYLFDPALILGAIFEKRFALAGLGAFLLLLPLAITSTKGWMKRLGKSWKQLHRLVYLAALLAITHYIWSVKSDIRQPLAFGAAVLLLLVARLPAVRRTTTRLRGWFASRQSTHYRNTLEGPS
jgi:sulfoxide reductase heme-binding subunit YedZ